MGDLARSIPAFILLVIGLAALATGIAWLMTPQPPFGAGGILAALGTYLIAWLIFLRIFTT